MKPRLLGLALALALLVTACGSPPTSPAAQSSPSTGVGAEQAAAAPTSVPAAHAPAAGSTLRVVTPFLSQPLDPARGGGFNAVQLGVGETLMRLDEQFSPVPWLASDVQAVDEKTWQITLRENATFHDGAKVDAAAVKASLERAIEQIATAKTLLDVAAMEVKDARTLLITTASANPRMPGLLTEPSTVIVNAAAAAAQGDDAFAQKPIMTGVFAIERFQQDQELVAVRHRGYWGTPARSERVVVNVQSDANARMLALQSGQVDIAVDIRPEAVQVAQNDANLKVVPAQPVATMFMYLNQTKPLWQDVQVRQALAYAFPPRNALVRTVLRGEGVAGVGPFPPAVLQCDNLQGYNQDMTKARALLAEAGLTDSNGDGTLEQNGQPVVMKVLSYPQRPALTPMAEIIQATLKEIGIGMEIQSVEQINEALAQQDWDGGMYFNNMAATGDPFGSLAQFYTAEGSANRGSYKNADVEALINQMRPVADRAERLKQACVISQRLLDDVAIIPLVYPNYNYGVSKAVTGFDQAHPYFLYFLNGNMARS